MISPSNSPTSARPGVFSAVASLFSVGVGLSVLLGWWLRVEILKAWLPGKPSARFNTAACFVLLGFALWELRRCSGQTANWPSKPAARIAAAIVVLVGLLRLSENVFGWNLGMDQWLYVVRPGDEIGSISPIAALDFVLLGCALLVLDWKTRSNDWPAQFLAVGAGILSMFGLLDFGLGLDISHTHIALPTAVGLAVFSLGVIWARADWAWGGLLASRGAGAMLLRRVAPPALLVINFVAWLASKALLTSPHFQWEEVSLIVVTLNVLLAGLVLWAALMVEHAEQKQERAEQALQIGKEKLDQLMERFEDSPVETVIRRWGAGGIALAVLLTGLMGLLSWRSAGKAAEEADWVAHSDTVVATIEATLKDAVDMETRWRGFAVTGEETFLDPYLTRQTAMRQDLDRLGQLVADNPAQQQRSRRLEQQIDACIEVSRRAVAERQETGAVPAKTLFVEGTRRMDEVRATVAEMQSGESKLFDQRSARTQEARRSTKVITFASTLMGVVLLLLAGFPIDREINNSTRMRGQLRALNADLEKRVEQRTAALQAEVTERKHAEEELGRSEKALREQTRLLQLVLDSIGDGLVAANKEGQFLLWNQAATKILGIGPKNLALAEWSRYCATYLPDQITPYPPDQVPLARAIRGETVDEEMFVRNPELKAGVWLEIAARPLKDESGIPQGGVAAFRDITVRKQAEQQIRQINDELEQRVQQRTAELEAANKELEAFTYSVSHDLRAPLRHICGFSKILTEEYGSGLAPEAQHHLQRIHEGTRRMGMLVDDLLNLGRVGRHELCLQVAGLNSVVNEAIAELKADCEGRQVEWKIGSLPFVEGDPGLMKQVFQNLLSNAVKFTRPRSQAIIEVGQENQEGVAVVFVRDNGVGFNMKYADRLFGVFQRLHRPEDFEGTGVGLAIVQRIIQRHGGRIWAEAELDKGATFYFTLGTSEKTQINTEAAMAGDAA